MSKILGSKLSRTCLIMAILSLASKRQPIRGRTWVSSLRFITLRNFIGQTSANQGGPHMGYGVPVRLVTRCARKRLARWMSAEITRGCCFATAAQIPHPPAHLVTPPLSSLHPPARFTHAHLHILLLYPFIPSPARFTHAHTCTRPHPYPPAHSSLRNASGKVPGGHACGGRRRSRSRNTATQKHNSIIWTNQHHGPTIIMDQPVSYGPTSIIWTN